MTKKVIERLLKRDLLSHFPDYIVKGRMIYDVWHDGILRAFFFDQSASDSNCVYVVYFILPLYVPRTMISFNFGDRLRNDHTRNSGWGVTDKQFEDLPSLIRVMSEKRKVYLDPMKMPIDFANAYKNNALKDLHVDEAVAYSWVLSNEEQKANDRLIKIINVESTTPWILDMQFRCKLILDILTHKGIVDAQLQLQSWQKESEQNLDL